MIRANWDDFNKKNKDKTKAFEDMCRVLFLRDRKKNAYDYSYNINEAGLEFQPVFDEKSGKWYGAQAKYFTTANNSTKYKEIYSSLSKAFKYYKGKLDYIYIYINAELAHECTDEQINSDSKTDRVKIAREARDNSIKLKWIQADNILDLVKESKNLDLYEMYFSDSREYEFIEDVITLQENTFLQSDEFMNLRFTNGETLESIYTSVLKSKYSLILGAAGTGKSMGIKNIYKEFSDRFKECYFGENESEEIIYIPVFIRLRECIHGNLESLIREKFNDYNLYPKNRERNFFYFFDGLDEVPYYDMDKIIYFIKQLEQQSSVKGITVSSRLDTNNLSYFRQEFQYNEYHFDKLKFDDINKYFNAKGDIRKFEKLKSIENTKIINEIDDVFSVNLLWENIDRINISTSKIEIIELAIEHWIRNYTKLNELSLLEPKQEKIYLLCQEIAYLMQKNMVLSLSIDEVQKLIERLFKIQSPIEINSILDALTDLFFECNKYNNNEIIISFIHRRFQEYFLYQKIEKEYYDNPIILRELKLLSNRDFIINIFLRTSLSRAEVNNDIYKSLSLRLLESYLGEYYILDYKDALIGRNLLDNYSEPIYSYSDGFLHLLSTYKPKDLEILFNSESIDISDSIKNDNFPEFVEIYHRINGEDISKLVKHTFEIKEIKTNFRNINNLCYYLYNIKNENIQTIYEKVLSRLTISHDDVSNMDYVAQDKKLLNSFINLSLEFEISYLTCLISNMDKYFLEVLSANLIKHKYINILLGNKKEFIEFRNEFINRIEKTKEDYYINTLAIYSFISKKEKDNLKLKEAFKKINIANFPTWSNNIELHIILAILQDEKVIYQLKEFKLGVDIVKIVYENYNNKKLILDEWLKIIKSYNYIYSDWLKYSNSHMIGALIANLEFDIVQLKKFLRELLNYESVIYMQTVLFKIYEYDKKLFNNLVNKGLLDKVLLDIINYGEDDYESLSESLFKIATMFDSIDSSKKYELLIMGIDNGIVRPKYRGEFMASNILTECIYLAYQNYWYDNNQLENKCYIINNILETINKTTDNYESKEHLKWIVNNCLIDSELAGKLYDVKEYPFHYDDKIFQYDMSLVNIDNLNEYYECKVKNVPYGSIQFWRELIKFEYSKDPELNILYQSFINMRYPSTFGYDLFKYCHLPTAILIEDKKTREKILKFIINQGGIYGMYNMIRVFYILGDMYEGIKYIEHLFKFCTMLISKVNFRNNNINSNYVLDEKNSINIREYANKKWLIDESNNEAILDSNHKIKITWSNYDEKEKFHENWAVNHPDESAYRYSYKLIVDGVIVKRFSLVWIDGYRAALPIPKRGTNIVNREEYLLSRIFNHSVEELNSYMRRSGLIVD